MGSELSCRAEHKIEIRVQLSFQSPSLLLLLPVFANWSIDRKLHDFTLPLNPPISFNLPTIKKPCKNKTHLKPNHWKKEKKKKNNTLTNPPNGLDYPHRQARKKERGFACFVLCGNDRWNPKYMFFGRRRKTNTTKLVAAAGGGYWIMGWWVSSNPPPSSLTTTPTTKEI